MPKRNKISYGRSKKMFTRGAMRKHPKNRLKSYVMRGGIRL